MTQTLERKRRKKPDNSNLRKAELSKTKAPDKGRAKRIEKRRAKRLKKSGIKTSAHKYIPQKNKTNSFTRRTKGYIVKLIINNMASIVVLLIQIIAVCLLGVVLVNFYGQRLSNAGESMTPTLLNGDVVLVDRLVYNAISPRRGDVIAFRPHGNENLHLAIRRVVALPGETVQIVDGRILVDEEEVSILHMDESMIEYAGLAAHPITLETNEFFVMGDNHFRSIDSRMADIGIVRRSDIYGGVWFSLGENRGSVR